MKIACLSDLHYNLPKLPAVDLVLIAGDLSNARYKDWAEERRWLYGPFSDWLESHSLPTIIVGGNHDFYIQNNIEEVRQNLSCTILENSATTFNGVKIFGTPYSREYCDWAYQATEPEHHTQVKGMMDLRDVFELEDAKDADIVLSHGPAYGICDKGAFGDRLGSFSLRYFIEINQPKLVLCGHIHSGYGMGMMGRTVVANCAYSTEQRLPRKEIIVMEFDEEIKEVMNGTFVPVL